MNTSLAKAGHAFVLLSFVSVPLLPAQDVASESDSAATAEERPSRDDETVVLSPFIVGADEETGYQAATTLAGSRVRTETRDIAAPISVVTSKFLKDTNAHSNQDLLTYTTNTEVGGLYGNYGGFGNRQGPSESGALLRPNDNTRVRGLEQADGTRNFFLSEIPWDSYNTDRVDIQRGPNSILFGVGSPAGIINASTIVARLTADSGNVSNELSTFGSVRWSLDYNKVLLKDQLAVRIAVLDSDRKFRQKPAFNKDQRLFATVTYQPQILDRRWASPLSIRVTAETGKITANNPRVLPPTDDITLWFDDIAGDGVTNPQGMGRKVYDPYLLESARFGNPGRGLDGTVKDAYYVPAYSYLEGVNGGGLMMFYHNGDSNPFLASREQTNGYPGGIAPDGTIDNTIGGIGYTSMMRSAGWNAYTYGINTIDQQRLANGEITADQVRFPLAERNYYKDRTLSDETIYNFYNQLVDGDNKRELSNWDARNVTVSQTLWDNRFGLEFVYDWQRFKVSREGLAWDRPFVAIDINANLESQYPQFSQVLDPDSGAMLIDLDTYSVPGFTPTASQPYANPNAGAAFIAGGANGNSSELSERRTVRVTGFAELRGRDFFDQDSVLARVLGRHVLTGLYTSEQRDRDSASWRNVATDIDWARGFSINGENTVLSEAARQVVPLIYLSGPLFDRTSAHDLNLGATKTVFDPSGDFLTRYYDATWAHPLDPNAPGYVDPAAETVGFFGETITESESPWNYAGWLEKPATILNSRHGDLEELYTSYTARREVIDSVGATWQGYLLDGDLVPTVGWRRDKLVTYSGSGAVNDAGVASPHANADVRALENTGDTVSWGVVAHLPKAWADRLPVITGVSAFYNRGKNNKVEARYNFDGEPLPNPTADSTDFGVAVRLLDDRLTVKVSHFETHVVNGNLPGSGSLIGDQQYYINNLEAWGTASALMDLFGYNGLDPNQNWYWNWAWVDSGYTFDLGTDPLSPEYRNHPSTIKQLAAISDFFAGMDQRFFDNYQIPVNVAALQAAYATGDVQKVAAAVADVFPVGSYTTSLFSENGGQINGITPNGTIDNTSKGYEIEANFAPTKNLELQVNASKTTAYRESLGAPMIAFINKQYQRFSGPAGDLRLWWGGDASIRQYYESNIISALRFQEEAVGSQAPELRPWHFAGIANYKFGEGRFRGFNVGAAWRWEDRQILGYGMKDDRSGLDVNKPISGQSESSVDLWLGYERKLNDHANWRVQLNLRNVGESRGLVPISANPDGSIAAQRITEGMTWAVSNSISF